MTSPPTLSNYLLLPNKAFSNNQNDIGLYLNNRSQVASVCHIIMLQLIGYGHQSIDDPQWGAVAVLSLVNLVKIALKPPMHKLYATKGPPDEATGKNNTASIIEPTADTLGKISA